MEKYVLGLELEPTLWENNKRHSKKSKDESCEVCHFPLYDIASKPKFDERIKDDNRAQNIDRVRWRKPAAIFNYHHEAKALCYLNQGVVESTQRWCLGSIIPTDQPYKEIPLVPFTRKKNSRIYPIWKQSE